MAWLRIKATTVDRAYHINLDRVTKIDETTTELMFFYVADKEKSLSISTSHQAGGIQVDQGEFQRILAELRKARVSK